ncbi:MAG: hypothetical protein MUF49_20810 [Oculatellaceae cyanobacterium Prado106]|jgi:iron complex transport system substrate-binding protein|nr:hypothetical protein [Oculatellaceae cyanobacterium Prado106]
MGLAVVLIACNPGQLLRFAPPTQPVPLASPIPSPCRSLHHALGETCVPLHPQRIATLTDVDMISVLALGLQPYATVFYSDPNQVPAYLKDKIGQVEILLPRQ